MCWLESSTALLGIALSHFDGSNHHLSHPSPQSSNTPQLSFGCQQMKE